MGTCDNATPSIGQRAVKLDLTEKRKLNRTQLKGNESELKFSTH